MFLPVEVRLALEVAEPVQHVEAKETRQNKYIKLIIINEVKFF